MNRFLAVCMAACFLAGCITTKPVMVSRAVVKNMTHLTIEEVSIMNPETRSGTSVSAILPGRELEVGVSPRELVAETALVRWRERDRSREVVVQLPEVPADLTGPAVLVFVVEPNGQVRARIRNDKKY